ncbi:MAG: histidinol-phosphate transaminase, partial [Anaerohalosphaera sp.]|nr:histidinol-phosphate transaminase [Anaerohalosphaera sp.]
GYTPGFQPAGSDVVKLNTNENPYPTSPAVLETLGSFDPEQLRRYPQPMGEKFRETAAEVLEVRPENIMCTNGGDDLLTICFRAFCDSRHGVAYPGPTYSLYPVLAKLQNCAITEFAFNDPDLFTKLADNGAALNILCNPNAPTGALITADQMSKLAGKLEGILLIDEAYTDFASENCLPLIADHDNVIILRSMSKGYSLAGIRFGFCIAQPTIINELMKVKDSYNVDAVAIEVASAAFADQSHFAQNVKKVIDERARLTSELRDMGLEINDSQTNFVLAKCIDQNAGDIYEKLAAKNIFVRYFNLEGLTDKLRITVGTPQQNDALLSALKEIGK